MAQEVAQEEAQEVVGDQEEVRVGLALSLADWREDFALQSFARLGLPREVRAMAA